MDHGAVPGVVVLKDGTMFSGSGFGAQGRVFGELVFNTSMSGYQEVVTDPSYHGQMVAFTYPLIGNYGVFEWLSESDTVHSRAVVVREAKNTAWDTTGGEGWVDWLAGRGVVGVAGVDTRALTRAIREQGAMTACVAAGQDLEVNELLAQTRMFPGLVGRDLVSAVTCREPYRWQGVAGRECAAPGRRAGRTDTAHRVIVYDYGVKRSILESLAGVGCEITVVPAYWPAEETLALRPDGVVLSNGPGDPAAVDYAVEIIRGLLGRVPVLGICLGHQLLALAIGLSTYKLKFGHRGANHPVRDYLSGKVEITSQNHGFAVEPPAVVREALERGSVVGKGGIASLRAEDLVADCDLGRVQITHLDLNDGTVEGLSLPGLAAHSVQYHPEAGPGPHDSRYLFHRFRELMNKQAG